ncbi:MAG: hypothetical protein ACTHOF_00995 [Flavisolibacter sp.]|jgi:hypothetical protein
MKILKSIFCILFSVCYFASSAQAPLNDPGNKPQLFSDLPQKMKVKVSDLASLLELPVGTSVHTLLAPGFNFHGTVVSTSPATDATLKSVVIKSTNRKGATFIFTKTIKADGTVAFLGRIISLKNGDAFEIVKENDQYILEKKNLAELVTE